jgi:RHS repeat-associated protein
MTHLLRLLTLLFALVFSSAFTFAQVPTATPPFSSSAGSPDVTDLANLNVHLDIPVVHKAGRGGMNFTYDLSYDSSVWYPAASVWNPVYNWGWRGITEAVTGYTSESVSETICTYYVGKVKYSGYTKYLFYDYVYHDPWGIPHPFPGTVTFYEGTSQGACIVGSNQGIVGALATDGSGLILNVPAEAFPPATITSPSGKILNGVAAGAGSSADRNGNEITVNSSGVFTDTLGTTALTVAGSGTPSSPTTFTYTAPSGAAAPYTMEYTTYSVRTNFGCSGITEYGANGTTTANLVSSIKLPDGTSYTIGYEATPGYSGFVTGRIASVTLPTGGTISYKYTGGNNGITCTDGSTAGLERYTPDTGSNYWNYTRKAETGAAYITIVTDPSAQANQTIIQFQGIYETQRDVYSGTAPTISTFPIPESTLQTSNLLREIQTCYNANTASCTSTAITLPITQRNVTRLLSGASSWGSAQTAEHIYKYNSNGSLIEQDDYDYGAGSVGALLKKTSITYASLTNIGAFRQQVTVTNGSGTTVSQTNYNYGNTVTATSGTPQHTTPAGSRGNLVSVNYYTNGSTYLTKSYSYFDTGNVYVATDVNGAQTTYTYGACGNSFPTSVSEPLGLSRSYTWDTNCFGGVQTGVTDENSQTTTTTYNDPDFWRPYGTTDPLGNETIMGYVVSGGYEIGVTASLEFDGSSSVANTGRGNDGLGRTIQVSHIHAPGSSSFDQTVYGYDSNGRSYTTSLPCVTTGPWTCPTTATTTTYDALNRVAETLDDDTGNTTYSYSQNDVLVTLGPAPTGENTKRHQYQYDGLGRLTSVCELTTSTGSGTCGQTNTQTGFWTRYTSDALGRLTGVTQNAQSSSTQSRSYVYDLMGRMTSETEAESGTSTYTYDTDSTCGTSDGDLVKKVDAAGNVICYAYDSLHRQTAVTYPSGVYSSVTPSRHFVFDSATVNGGAMANAKGRLAEAYTCSGSCTSKITDLGFSYTVRGELANAYESTPNSNGYYNVAATYWANGLLNQLSGVPSVPTITYSPDGEGRINTVSASSGQNLVIVNGSTPGTSYNAAGQVTQLNLGSGDSDTFSYDNMDRMSQYQFNINGQSETGALTWNPNGTLGKLVITDPFNSGDNQTCTYVHDDLARIASANCGSVWSQTFAYDPFGNIVKSGSSSFQATYSTTTNQITQIAGSTPTYDANGNVTNDFLNTYSWDSNARPITIDGITVTYDALGRIAEEDKSGTYTQFVYSPTGQRIALMNGQSLYKAYVPLPAGASAAYNSGGLNNYHHTDWLGNFRLGSTPSRTMYIDIAYGPFGEPYADSGGGTPAFTGMTSDTVATAYDFAAREYGYQGRWPSPDPSGNAAFHLTDPQSINRYAYVRNSPLSNVDPTGLEDCDAGDLGCNPFLGISWGGGGGGGSGPLGGGGGFGGGGSGGGSGSGSGPSAGDPGNSGTQPPPSSIDCSQQPSLCSVTVTMIGPNSCTEDSILCAMNDPTQCDTCGAIMSGTDIVVSDAGWAEIGVASLIMGLGELGVPAAESTFDITFDATADPATWITDATEPGSQYPNFNITTTSGDAQATLAENGYSITGTTSSGGPLMSNGINNYAFYIRNSTQTAGMMFNNGVNIIKYTFIGAP